MTELVSRQKTVDINVNRQQITNRVLVFGAVQTPNRIRPTWLRILLGVLIESCFHCRQHGCVFRLGRPFDIRRRHLPRRHSLDDLLPRFRIPLFGVANHARIKLAKIQASRWLSTVVAGDTVPIDDSRHESQRVLVTCLPHCRIVSLQGHRG